MLLLFLLHVGFLITNKNCIVLIHSGSTVAFLLFSQMVEYRFYHVSVSGIYEVTVYKCVKIIFLEALGLFILH